MDVSEPRLRHRGFFLHSDTTGESDTGELENPEGFVVRVRITRSHTSKSVAPRGVTHGRSRTVTGPADDVAADQGQPEFRSGSATGSRQRPH